MDKKEALDKIKILEKELKNLKEIVEKPEDIFTAITYPEVCKRLGEKEITLKDFKQFDEDLSKKLLNTAIINQLVKYFNQGWKPNWKDTDEYKWYPYYTLNNKGGLVFYHSFVYHSRFCGSVGLFKTKEICDFIGKTFIDIYEKIKG